MMNLPSSVASPVVCVIDDDVSIRDSLRNLFSSVGLKVETFGTAQEFLASPPDDSACLVLDVRLPGLSGLELQQKLQEANIRIPIIFVTGHGDIQMSVRAMKAGAVDFLTKPFRHQDLLDAVQLALDKDRAARKQRTEVAELRGRLDSLSPREREVFGMVVRGLLNKQIASMLKMSEATVKLHRGHAMEKMRAQSFADLIRMAEKLEIPGDVATRVN
jgi:FixJ family two-component response regulator